jgi:hypothetical protein
VNTRAILNTILFKDFELDCGFYNSLSPVLRTCSSDPAIERIIFTNHSNLDGYRYLLLLAPSFWRSIGDIRKNSTRIKKGNPWTQFLYTFQIRIYLMCNLLWHHSRTRIKNEAEELSINIPIIIISFI